MADDRYIYTEKLSEEEQEVLRLSRKLRRMGKDPVKLLNALVETGEKIEKPFSIGKNVGAYFKQQWERSKEEFRKGKDEAERSDNDK
jgi:hypothetical protein